MVASLTVFDKHSHKEPKDDEVIIDEFHATDSAKICVYQGCVYQGQAL